MVDQLRFEGRVAIISGAGRGLGESYAHALAARGAAVVVNDLGIDVHGHDADETVAESVAQAIRDAGGRAIAHPGDVSNPDAASSMVQLAIEEFGGLDIVVSNAAIRTARSFSDTSADDIRRHFNADSIATHEIAKAAWPHFLQTGYGRVVVTSSSAILGSNRALAYAVAKGATTVVGRSLSFAAAQSGANIKVNLVAPHALTRMLDGVYDTDPAAQELRHRFGNPAWVAETIVVLAHECCPVNGNSYSIGAGQVRRIFMGETEGIAGTPLSAEEQYARWAEIDSTANWRILEEDTVQFSYRIYDRAAELFPG